MKFEKIHYCKVCGMFFVFSSDVEDHQRMVGHSEFVGVDF
jgi:hypothetical protein